MDSSKFYKNLPHIEWTATDMLCSPAFRQAKKELEVAERTLERVKRDIRFAMVMSEENFIRGILINILNEDEEQIHRLRRLSARGQDCCYHLAFDEKVIGTVHNTPGTDHFVFEPAEDFIPLKK